MKDMPNREINKYESLIEVIYQDLLANLSFIYPTFIERLLY